MDITPGNDPCAAQAGSLRAFNVFENNDLAICCSDVANVWPL
jgi:hypothetical protein